jgi:hypothetical protein
MMDGSHKRIRVWRVLYFSRWAATHRRSRDTVTKGAVAFPQITRSAREADLAQCMEVSPVLSTGYCKTWQGDRTFVPDLSKDREMCP